MTGVAEGAENQVKSVEQTTGVINQMQASWNELTNTIADVQELNNQTAVEVENGSVNVQDTARRMNVVKEQMDKIGGIINALSEQKVTKVGNVFENISQSIASLTNHHLRVGETIMVTNGQVERVHQSTETIQSISEQSSQRIGLIASGAEQQNAAMQQLLASSQELAAMAHELESYFSNFKI
ncbi:hypothetical protein MUN88_20895 [Gracilibacillus caseinilyticus]|uniref:Methyl-accepting chemotaxis protein n=1 Tax=Gracilibacillus caseinilyticus TaxID=2932256 RepID=A0ABY4EVN2_9BACI|nr:hypothetical protein [Gracilibacillus caseinilyticus]UOQ48458.1 hypothetical protein MUN88_20895 [Gracilibacillus caseinilyticus]